MRTPWIERGNRLETISAIIAVSALAVAALTAIWLLHP
jgi:hypothetical protein